MKYLCFYSFIILLSFIFLCGCSNTHMIQKDFTVNSHKLLSGSKDREVNVKLKDGTSYTGSKFDMDYSHIRFLIPHLTFQNITINRDSILSMEHYKIFADSIVTQKIEMLNGDIILGNVISEKNKSLLVNKVSETRKIELSVKEVEKISYKSKGRGLLIGLLVGTLSGIAIGGFTEIIPANENRPSFSPPYQRTEYNRFNSFILGTLSGAILGSVAGWLLGLNYNYYF